MMMTVVMRREPIGGFLQSRKYRTAAPQASPIFPAEGAKFASTPGAMLGL